MPKTKLNLVLGEGGMAGAFVASDTGLGTHKKPSWLRARSARDELAKQSRRHGHGPAHHPERDLGRAGNAEALTNTVV